MFIAAYPAGRAGARLYVRANSTFPQQHKSYASTYALSPLLTGHHLRGAPPTNRADRMCASVHVPPDSTEIGSGYASAYLHQ